MLLLPRSVRFSMDLCLMIPCIGCCIFILYHFLVDRTFRRALNNHVIIVITVFVLFIDLTDGLWFLYLYQVGMALSPTPTFCLIWKFLDYYESTVMILLVGWTSIERHILIFHEKWVSTKRKCFIIHYLPLILITIYPFIFHIFVVYILPCDNTYDYTSILCDDSDCFSQIPIAFMWDSIVHNLIPASTIVIFSSGLLLRVLWQKRRLNQKVQWRNYRKMTIQMLSISAIYCILYIPPTLLYVAFSFGLPFRPVENYYASVSFFAHYAMMFTPITFAISLTEFREKFKIIFRCCRRPVRAVGSIGKAMIPAVINH